MNPDDLARLSARLDAAVAYWRDERRRKAHPHVIEDARDRANRLLNDLSDAIVLAQTAPKPKRGTKLAADGLGTPIGEVEA